MNFDDYCQQKAAPPGSSTYYALRQASAASQPLLTALFALRRELEETVQETSDPAVGRTKLAWWQKELAALAAGSASHPVSKALEAHLPDAPAEYPALQQMLAGFEMDLDQARYLDYPNLRRYMRGVGGNFASLIARSAASKTTRAADAAATATDWAASLGEALMLAQFVAETGNDARHGRIYIPIDEMQRYNVTAADLINRKYTDAFTELMRFETKRARDAVQTALAAVPANARRAQRTLLALAALALALLDEIERDGYHVLHQRIALTPIRKLWIAWRAK
ncbi:squalene/phytoene synthase family protein [Paraburkholderia sp. MMS20-SJTR3]|uniref:Squalene/phytoene synthase family protein n=1 Tax=Paraburkholderia sejongensis TaxID=2886946 RepID=A0ABS8JNB2_9BURK|nr:squalene/phytoene synthase family protein [Paraburkholderia sp. MMS20-SJTR3]MCC8391382.1 squalene/phytoene synthase family protein [Paraburkholderia sp. MMS20-SJTR3]